MLPEPDMWDAKSLHEMEGTTWQPVPGYTNDHALVEIGETGKTAERENEYEDSVTSEAVAVEEDNNNHHMQDEPYHGHQGHAQRRRTIWRDPGLPCLPACH